MFRRMLVISSLLALLFTFVTVGGIASAATNSSTVDFAAMQKKCTVIEIHLNGGQHTITCLRTSKVHKDLREIACGQGITNITVWYSDYAGQACYTGFGYLGVHFTRVNEVDNDTQSGPYEMWMRYYNPNGVTCTIPAYQYKLFGSGLTNVEVTQLDYGTSNGPTC